METTFVFIIGVVTLLCMTALAILLDEKSYKKIIRRRIRNLKKKILELKKENSRLKEDARWPEYFSTIPLKIILDQKEKLENEIKALEHQRNYYRDLLTYNRDTGLCPIIMRYVKTGMENLSSAFPCHVQDALSYIAQWIHIFYIFVENFSG